LKSLYQRIGWEGYARGQMGREARHDHAGYHMGLAEGDKMRGRVILINWDGNMLGRQNYFEVL